MRKWNVEMNPNLESTKQSNCQKPVTGKTCFWYREYTQQERSILVMTLHPARSLCWLDFLDENEKFGYFILIIITYKQTEFPVTLLSWSFEISVLAGFCTAALTILGSSLHIWFWTHSTEFSFVQNDILPASHHHQNFWLDNSYNR